MSVSKTDIIQIRDFVAKRGFTEPDLQIEIIDHMACRVEEMLAADPRLSFTQAIDAAHAEFGIFGFSVFEDAMRSNLQKRYWLVFRQMFAANFSWKTVPLMVAMVYLLTVLFNAINKPQIIFTVTGFLMLAVLGINGVLNDVRYKRYRKMLTFKMGSIYLVISVVLFNAYNIFIIQLEFYRFFNANVLGIIFSTMSVSLFVIFYSINQTQQHAVTLCRQLEEKYTIAMGLIK